MNYNPDYVDPTANPNDIETYGVSADPNERKAQERQASQQFMSQINQMKRDMRDNPDLKQALYDAGEDRVYLKNNRAKDVQVTDDEIGYFSIPGQLTFDVKGPFRAISRKKLDNSVQLSSLLETPINRNGFDERNLTILTELTDAEYKRELKDFLEIRKGRLADNNVEQWSAARHEDGSIDEWDQSYEVNKVNFNVIRSKG